MYLHSIFHIPRACDVGAKVWSALAEGKIDELTSEYNRAVANLPFKDFANADEYFYRALLLMLLQGTGLNAHGEVASAREQSDDLVECGNNVLVIEFKLAKKTSEIKRKMREGARQLNEKGYLTPSQRGSRTLTAVVFVIDSEKRVTCSHTLSD